jgi:hypothetical protein
MTRKFTRGATTGRRASPTNFADMSIRPIAFRCASRSSRATAAGRIGTAHSPKALQSAGRAKKPEDYQAIPYRSTALDPFDSELIADDILWPEGEKDVDSLSNLNLPAFTFGGVGDGRMSKLWPSTEARWPARLALVTDWKRADEGGLEDIEEWCRSVTDPVMVIIDTLEKFRPLQKGNSAAYSADYAAVTSLQKIAGQHRIAIVINHHVRKMEADDPFDTVSGTLGLTGAADTIIVLKRHAGAVTLHARGRDIEEIETALQFERTTCRWTILGTAAEVYVSNERAAVLTALAGSGAEGLAVPEIMAAAGGRSRGAMDTLLFKMKEAGDIVRVKRGVYALPQDGGKIGQKERNGIEAVETTELSGNLSILPILPA